jgi:DNA-binding response OmpR family regulator
VTVKGSRFAGLRILIVEDNFNIASAIARVLKAQGAEVAGPVPAIPDALALIANGERIDTAVLDINLRGALVYPVVDVLRSKGVPVVFITGYDQEAVMPGYGDIPLLHKPFATERLIEAIAATGTKTATAG